MIKPTSLRVLSFGEESFFDAIRSKSMTRTQAGSDQRARYLFDYLTAMEARTIVVEAPYVDGAYLDDFANYYVKSFSDYERHCRRLHFFKSVFREDEINKILVGAADGAALLDSYLGFVVARPLPAAIVGRTLLAHYPDDNGRRHYPAVARHFATLCGLPLAVDSLPFQQQDRVLAACATVALWSSFQQCKEIFGSAAPSPAEITRQANAAVTSSRALPSQGLTLEQMCRAVAAVGLEPEVIACTPKVPLLSLIHGYLSYGLPVILIADIEEVGRHAIALAGYSLVDKPAATQEDWVTTSPPLRRIGLRINELYGHDDGVGPFARLHVRELPAPDEDRYTHIYLEGTWKVRDGSRPAKISPRYVLVPVYHKVRLTFLDVQKWLARLNQVLAIPLAEPGKFEWDVELTDVNSFKAGARSQPASTQRDHILLGSYPRFLWHARLRVEGAQVLEVLFDATDMEPAYPFCDLIFSDAQLQAELAHLVHAQELTGPLTTLIGPQLLEFLQGCAPRR